MSNKCEKNVNGGGGKILLLFLTILLISASLFYVNVRQKNNTIHLSFDDVIDCMYDISKDSSFYNSVFEHPFFSSLKHYHEEYGTCFSLFLFCQNDDFKLEDFPIKYKSELTNNSSWLKFGYHCKCNVIHASNLSDQEICESFDYCKEQILRFSSIDNFANTIRLHNFYGNKYIVNHLFCNGIKTLLCADDNRLSYDLTEKQNSILLDNSGYDNNHYLRTDIRLESNLFPELKMLYLLCQKDSVVVFTHEYANFENKLERILFLADIINAEYFD